MGKSSHSYWTRTKKHLRRLKLCERYFSRLYSRRIQTAVQCKVSSQCWQLQSNLQRPKGSFHLTRSFRRTLTTSCFNYPTRSITERAIARTLFVSAKKLLFFIPRVSLTLFPRKRKAGQR